MSSNSDSEVKDKIPQDLLRRLDAAQVVGGRGRGRDGGVGDRRRVLGEERGRGGGRLGLN